MPRGAPPGRRSTGDGGPRPCRGRRGTAPCPPVVRSSCDRAIAVATLRPAAQPVAPRGRAGHRGRRPREGDLDRKGSKGLGDKISNQAEELKGKAKEAFGDATDNERLQAEGQADQAKANTKQAGENVKDAASNVFGDDRK